MLLIGLTDLSPNGRHLPGGFSPVPGKFLPDYPEDKSEQGTSELLSP